METFMFTLNELYSASVAQTTALLLKISEYMRVGAVLLVVDSPGSYSTVRFSRPQDAGEGRGDDESSGGAREKRYAMHWLLDRTLLETARVARGQTVEDRWQKTFEDTSRWFRRARDVTYPIALEDMRYQVHAYVRV